jgi:hypothetical protein
MLDTVRSLLERRTVGTLELEVRIDIVISAQTRPEPAHIAGTRSQTLGSGPRPHRLQPTLECAKRRS